MTKGSCLTCSTLDTRIGETVLLIPFDFKKNINLQL